MSQCLWCDEAILPGEDLGTPIWHEGVRQPTHRECSLRQVLGGIGHHLDHAYWCGEKKDPDAGMTYRQSAQHVMRIVEGWARTEDSRG